MSNILFYLFSALIIRGLASSELLQCFANLKDLLVFLIYVASFRIIFPLFVKTTTTMTNAMSTLGAPPSSLYVVVLNRSLFYHGR